MKDLVFVLNFAIVSGAACFCVSTFESCELSEHRINKETEFAQYVHDHPTATRVMWEDLKTSPIGLSTQDGGGCGGPLCSKSKRSK